MVIALSSWFPGTLNDPDNIARLIYAVTLLGLVSSGIVVSQRVNMSEALRNAAIWLGIMLLLVIGYSYRDVWSEMGTRVAGELVPGQPVTVDGSTVELRRTRNGSFHAYASVEGTRVLFLVDTGASDVTLTHEDATRIGIDTSQLKYTVPYNTANGQVYSARVDLDSITLNDTITIRNVRASVSKPGRINTSLLGLSFLDRLNRYEVRGDRLVLEK